VRTFDAAGIVVPVPAGWEARGVAPTRGAGRQGDGSVAYPYLHLANVALPAGRAPYGGGVVERLGARDVFVALLEFAPQSARTALFTSHVVPRRLRPTEFSGTQLQRTLKGQLGLQRFFRIADRALCCYVVMGGAPALRHTLDDVNRVLSGLRVFEAAPAR
jgi:hypothetical protein